jgi:hypothetical protein
MRLKFVMIDLEFSRCAKRAATGVAVAFLLAGAGINAFAGVANTWTGEDTLTGAGLNGNFTALDARLTALEQAGPLVVAAWRKYTPPLTEGGIVVGATETAVPSELGPAGCPDVVVSQTGTPAER